MKSIDIKLALRNRHRDDFFLCECKTGSTWFDDNLGIIDALAVKKSWVNPTITAYEIKVSTTDFKNDTKWIKYMKVCDCFYFACPKGLITKKDIQVISENNPGVGLVYINDAGVARTVIKALHRHVPTNPDLLMYIIMNRLDSDRHPFHSTKADYYKDWLADKISNERLGLQVGRKLTSKLEVLENQIRKLKNEIYDLKQKQLPEEKMEGVISKLNSWDISDIEKILEAFNKPRDLIALINACKIIAKTIPTGSF